MAAWTTMHLSTFSSDLTLYSKSLLAKTLEFVLFLFYESRFESALCTGNRASQVGQNRLRAVSLL